MLMERLRRETRARHEAVERSVDFASRLSSRDAYIELLRRMLGLHEPFEAALANLDWRSIGLDLGERRKSRFIVDDLRVLGLSGRDIESVPRCDTLPAVTGLSRGVGCLYVIEGSTLGGAMIAKELSSRLGIAGPAAGGAFYASYGRDIGPMWRRFGAAAERGCDSEQRRDEAVAAAIETFDCFDSWFRRP